MLRYLVSCSDDKHTPQDEALAVHVALVTRPPGPYEVLPHSQTNEAQGPHFSLQRAIKVFLQTEATVSRIERGAIVGGCRCRCWPFHRCKFPQQSAVWSPGSLRRYFPSPRQPEGPRALPAGASERTAQRPPAEGYEVITAALIMHLRRVKSCLSPLCTEIIRAVAQPWSRHRWLPRGSLLLWSYLLQTEQEFAVFRTRLSSATKQQNILARFSILMGVSSTFLAQYLFMYSLDSSTHSILHMYILHAKTQPTTYAILQSQFTFIMIIFINNFSERLWLKCWTTPALSVTCNSHTCNGKENDNWLIPLLE